MKTTIEFLNAVKEKHHLHSDGRLAAKLELTRSSVSRLMSGKDHPSDTTALKIADLLETDPAHVVACIHAERAKTEKERKIWERFAIMTAGVSAAVLLAFMLPSQVSDSNEYLFAGFTALSRPMYIMLNANPVYYMALSLLFALMLTGYPPHTTGKKL